MSTPNEMVERQLAARGIDDEAVLEAMRHVPREAFVPEEMQEFAYADAPLPIGEEQTISQPYIVALMAQALHLSPGDRVLDVGTGSGYAAAVLAEIADEVYSIERHASLAEAAEERFEELGYENVHVRHGDGTLGWPEHAPYDAITVAASGPEIPEPLLDQLKVGGRLIAPAGRSERHQELILVRREREETYRRSGLGGVRFVPLIGEAGWIDEEEDAAVARSDAPPEDAPVREHVAFHAEPIDAIEGANLDALLERIGDARVVLLGEASHGTAEFYQMRAEITKALIEQKGFRIIAAEADWPDAASIDRYVRTTPASGVPKEPFKRFPTWMWANAQVLEFIEWLRDRNASVDPAERAGFYGLDLYSLHTSIEAVLEYLDDVDPEAAGVARQRYGCLTPYEQDPAAYGAAAARGRFKECEEDVVRMLRDLLDKRFDYSARDGQRFMDAVQNARLVANAERYYRSMYRGMTSSWNLRDSHMFEVLQTLLDYEGPDSKAVVWAHNSHLGNAAATEMGARGQHNVGQLCCEAFGREAYLVGFGTDRGTVAAASNWGGEMEVKDVRPAHERSYEHLMHETQIGAFSLPLRSRGALRDKLMEERLERAIGVIYRPETELQSHYFHASLPRQFDEYIWFDETHAVTPLGPEHHEGMPETFPFGL